MLSQLTGMPGRAAEYKVGRDEDAADAGQRRGILRNDGTFPGAGEVNHGVTLTAAAKDTQLRLDFVPFYQREWQRTVRLAHLLGAPAAEAEDVAQEAFLRLRPGYDTAVEPAALLRQITINLTRSRHRAAQRRLARDAHGVFAEARMEQPTIEIMELVRKLPFRQRSVLVLRYWVDLSESDIAQAIECRVGTVKSLHHRALTNLRKEELS